MKDQSNVRDKSEETRHGSPTSNKQQGTQPEGVSWQFYVIMAVLGLGVLGLVAKVLGIF